ncbi:hypothetical protein DM01DRAFT_1316337 [Hesseltinella vesiculosa]|uniref:DUF92-domain-containing protein n=1 Tax=Hesseltinella vesiculosa TaxID=101127 RepID=A0A1X2GU69_9FUNG|nr:hypothetical protein DM01DRAFT_1316337 [Hesseltinella vesiculosa]
MDPFVFAFVLSSLFVIYTQRKKSLTNDGAAGAFVVGLITFSASYWYFAVVNLTFFFTSSRLTKFKADRKRLLEDDFDKCAQRNLTQVICNGLGGTIAVAWFHTIDSNQCYASIQGGSILIWAYLGHYAACCGDTWASELGILNKSWPYLITKWKQVPPGTNGGVSPLGLAASLGGGLLIGLVGAISLSMDPRCNGIDYRLILLGAAAGLGGSLIDSVLGATVQRTMYSKDKKLIVESEQGKGQVEHISGWDILDNHQVNLVTSLLTTGLCGLASYYFA